MAENCGFCLQLPEKFKCGWCNDHCNMLDICEQRFPLYLLWTSKDQLCSQIKIFDFNPKTGPFEGGTNITIEGINLGNHFEDIAKFIHIADGNNTVVRFITDCILFRVICKKYKSDMPSVEPKQNKRSSGHLKASI
ncbi:Plexin-A2-like protein [Leptotrombidium deliense]|uniref:Plexin-A2-like protein n=1 Tax=Leptotrombidium deliense TaxID=299467 RepID=A0A443QP87_9ACAR|nr:Plexin-A2-like protein [Leptotrombidium deliense]